MELWTTGVIVNVRHVLFPADVTGPTDRSVPPIGRLLDDAGTDYQIASGVGGGLGSLIGCDVEVFVPAVPVDAARLAYGPARLAGAADELVEIPL